MERATCTACRQADFGVSGDGVYLVHQRFTPLAVRISRRAAHDRPDGGHKPGYPAVIVIKEGKLWHGGRLPACPNLVQARTLIF